MKKLMFILIALLTVTFTSCNKLKEVRDFNRQKANASYVKIVNDSKSRPHKVVVIVTNYHVTCVDVDANTYNN